jgi:hypothetical protein
LSLGAPVVGIASRDGIIGPSISEYFDVDGITLVGEHFEPNIEVVASLKPDLIVHEGFDGETSLETEAHAALSSLAARREHRRVPPDRRVHARLRRARRWRRDRSPRPAAGRARRVDHRAAARARRRMEERAGVVRHLQRRFARGVGPVDPRRDEPTDQGRRVVGTTHGEADLPKHGGYISSISEERIPEFSADLVLVDTSYGGDAILRHPLFRALPAAQAGQVIEFDSSELTDTHYPGVITIAEFLIEQIEAMDLETDLV